MEVFAERKIVVPVEEKPDRLECLVTAHDLANHKGSLRAIIAEAAVFLQCSAIFLGEVFVDEEGIVLVNELHGVLEGALTGVQHELYNAKICDALIATEADR